MRVTSAIALGILVCLARPSDGQDMLPLVESAETRYYNFWVGRWAEVKDGVASTEAAFTVIRGVHPGALEETWHGAAGSISARAFRSWDKTAGHWMHVWISGNGLFQVWEGRKVGDDWYMHKEFDITGDKYLSRQAILKHGENEAERVSERSNDGGQTWTLRFRQRLRRLQ